MKIIRPIYTLDRSEAWPDGLVEDWYVGVMKELESWNKDEPMNVGVATNLQFLRLRIGQYRGDPFKMEELVAFGISYPLNKIGAMQPWPAHIFCELENMLSELHLSS